MGEDGLEALGKAFAPGTGGERGEGAGKTDPDGKETP
jgi:hypothetical protein